MTEAFYRIKDGSAAVNLFRDLISTISLLHDMNTYLYKRLVLDVYTSPAFSCQRLDLYIGTSILQGLIFYLNMCSYHVKKLY